MVNRLLGRVLLLSLFLSKALLGTDAETHQIKSQRPREHLRGVLSRAVLSPPVQGDAAVRFSPDGKFLFVQDSSGVMPISRDPLMLISYISAPYAYPVRFSADSKTIMLISYDLAFSRWRVSDGTRLESRDLPVPDGCLSVSLSPNGNFFSCYTPDFGFALYRLDSGQKVLSSSFVSHPIRQARSPGPAFTSAPVPVRLDTSTFFSAPFGFVLEGDLKPLANRGLMPLPVWYSPDGKFLVGIAFAEFFKVDLATFKRENLPSFFQNRVYSVGGIFLDDRVLAVDLAKHEAASLPLSGGRPVPIASLSADFISLTGDPRYAMARKSSDLTARLFDLEANQFLPAVECVAADIHDDLIAALKSDRILEFFHRNQASPFLAVHLPLGGLPPLRAAAVSPSLDSLAFSVDGAGGVFRLPSGTGLPDKKPFNGATLSDARDFVFFAQAHTKPWKTITRYDPRSGNSTSAWIPRELGDLHPSENAFIEYSLFSLANNGVRIGFDSLDVPYNLRGLDPQTGEQLWQDTFRSSVPIPFADPQGSRFVLAWKAKSDGGRNALNSLKAHCEVCKGVKLSEHDTVFEVRDSRTGKPLGSALAQIGAGAISFSAAFSAGKALLAVKDDIRISVFSIETGKLIGHVKGLHPSASGESGLFVLDEGSGLLGVFDLSTSEKIEEQQFADEIAYMHFSSDGKRVLVMTQHQEVFVLDMSDVREHPLAPQHQTPDPSADPADQPQ